MSPRRRKPKAVAVASQLAELAFAVPQVVAHRVARMALAGATPNARDRKEFKRMVAEKKVAFGESWSAMAAEAMRANQSLALSMFQSFWAPSRRDKPSAGTMVEQIQSAASGVLSAGIAPVKRKAVGNAKRLRSTKLR